MQLEAASGAALCAEALLKHSPEVLEQFVESLTEDQAYSLKYDWDFWARPNQRIPDGDWFIWLLRPGRGWGKTRAGAESVLRRIREGTWRTVALVNDTSRDTRQVMVEGPSGVLTLSPPWFKPIYNPSKAEVMWPNGAKAYLYAAEAPEMLRGPEHDGAWTDEPAKWRNLRKKDPEGLTAWDNLMMGLRTGPNPQCIATTTPRRTPWMAEILRRPNIVVTRGTSYDNIHNLAKQYVENVLNPYRNTRIGRQEIDGDLLTDVDGALWTYSLVEQYRVEEVPILKRIVVAIDPAVTAKSTSDETGMIVAGLAENGHAYVIADLSGRMSPHDWGRRAIEAYGLNKADRIIGEANNGGDLVEQNIRTVRDENDNPVGRNVSFKKVTASRGKVTRAEPISAMYEQGRVHHVGMFPDLEDQMTQWVPGEKSPDRMDALVWALTELMDGTAPAISPQGSTQSSYWKF